MLTPPFTGRSVQRKAIVVGVHQVHFSAMKEGWALKCEEIMVILNKDQAM